MLVHYIHFWGLSAVPPNGILPGAKFTFFWNVDSVRVVSLSSGSGQSYTEYIPPRHLGVIKGRGRKRLGIGRQEKGRGDDGKGRG